jgi:hypothetical protein
MPKVTHVKRARKDYPNHGIKKGDSYYWWKFRYGRKYMSKTFPKASQLTRSEYLSRAYELHEEIQEYNGDRDLQEIADEVRELGEEQYDKVSNMPDSLQDSETAQLLEQRAESCEDFATEIESAAGDKPEGWEYGDPINEHGGTELEDEVAAFIETVRNLDFNIE